jgi:hypothetical protein
MKYYQNKETSEIIGVENMREVISFPNQQSMNLGYKGYSYEVVYDMICPNKILSNGITSFCVTHAFLITCYKRINKKLALSKYPEFKQYSYEDLVKESDASGLGGYEILKKQRF